jgi:ubiquinone biosynthesis protein
MLNDVLLESLGLSRLVPPSLAAWRPLVIDGMNFFLEHLPAHRQEAIITAQLALPQSADAAVRLATLLSQCPTLHKLGQVLARNKHIPVEVRRQLQTLETMEPSTPMEQILARLREELGQDVPVALADSALAEGSVAVVLPFTWQEHGETRHGVFKVLKPGIEERFAGEIAIWVVLGEFLEERSRELRLPALDFRRTLDSIRELLTHEIDLRVEQDNLRQAHALYASEPRLLIPRLLPWCTPRVTAMERVFGKKVTEADLPTQSRAELAAAMVSALVAQPFWSQAPRALFHADLHAGNLLATNDGRLAVLDWSLTLGLSKEDREKLVSMIIGGLTLDAKRIRNVVASLGTLHADDPVLVRAVDKAFDGVVFERQFPGFDWLLTFLDALALETAAGFREDFVLFRKTWFSLSDVIGDLAGAHSPDVQLLKFALERFLIELPARLHAPPASNCFSTHVSNTDLLQASASAWLVPMRYCERLQRRLPALDYIQRMSFPAWLSQSGSVRMPNEG